MTIDRACDGPRDGVGCSRSKACRYFSILSLAGLSIILVAAGFALRHVVRTLVILQAEEEAAMMARVARDCEIREYMIRYYMANEPYLTIPAEDLPEVDRDLKVLMDPLDIVKLKIYNTEPRVIYSTDPNAIGKMDADNRGLASAMAGTPVSKYYEVSSKVLDIEGEQRINVEMIESYVPVYGPDGRLIGAFEIYRNAEACLGVAGAILWRGWAILAAAVIGVFAALMWVIRREAVTIESHINSLAGANEKLLAEAEERKRLEREVVDIVERERQRTGRELHDSVGQQFAGTIYMLEALESRLAEGPMAHEAPNVGKVIEQVKRAAEQARDLARGLDPIHLDTGGLVAALEELAASAEQMFGITCTVKCDGPVNVTDLSVATNVYRIAQEAITNAVKHGKAGKVSIELMPDDGSLVMVAENNGLDFEGDSTGADGMGLKIMRYRAETMNSTLEIRSRESGGAVVTCVFPNKTADKK